MFIEELASLIFSSTLMSSGFSLEALFSPLLLSNLCFTLLMSNFCSFEKGNYIKKVMIIPARSESTKIPPNSTVIGIVV
jgi:hypothetical protein